MADEQGICTVGGGFRPRREANPLTGEVGCEPFKSNSLEIRMEKGVAFASHRDRLTPLRVVFGTEKFRVGDLVYFEAEQCASVWGKRIYTLDDGTKFILAPANNVKLVERKHLYED